MINEAHKKNFETLRRAFVLGQVALADCTDQATGEPVVLIVAVGQEGEDVVLSPLAQMIDGNPYDLFSPPTTEETHDRRKDGDAHDSGE